MKISGCVITRNEARNIERCLKSMGWCDEILVVDSNSVDRTRDIASGMGARVLERTFDGYRTQRQFTIDQATHDWILFLDADEWLEDSAIATLVAFKNSGTTGDTRGYWLQRRNRYYGVEIRNGDWRSDRGLRLFDRRHARVVGRQVHEHIGVTGKTAAIDASIVHDSYADYDEQCQKLERYAQMMAEDWFNEKRKPNYLASVVNPMWRFFRSYVLRAGFRDGWRGYVIALAEAHYVRQKFIRHLVLERSAEAMKKTGWRPTQR